ncbi:MAG: SDR family oxidoreductase [Actinomycetota bacterium]|nr:SDR family oxidoreductase [Actinomycetota bacterium]
MPQELQGKVALVTGGSKGIGRAIALAYADAGADVALAARGPEALEKTQREVEERGQRSIAVPTDVADEAQVRALVDRTTDELGGLDILVNNAGAAPFLSTVDSIRLAGFEKYFRINFMSAVFCTQAAAPTLIAKGRDACVVNVASVAGTIASPGLAYYSSAKAALINFTKTVAREWAPHGVRVNAIAPGWVETEMNEGARQSAEWYETVRSLIPIGRWAKAEEVASVALFLASDAASYMTGSVVVVDGGQTVTALAGQ